MSEQGFRTAVAHDVCGFFTFEVPIQGCEVETELTCSQHHIHQPRFIAQHKGNRISLFETGGGHRSRNPSGSSAHFLPREFLVSKRQSWEHGVSDYFIEKCRFGAARYGAINFSIVSGV
jgi:hypothetical protein